ncbi:hypothetical protein CRENBAI_016694 [Crenichthys baileyi]|uniref:Amino acid transporter n=1 Tax=Crenichthys baileyi TaxID=28760 RepID=A0AAV9RCL8_9TELE
MPFTSSCCRECNKIDSRIISFMLPIATNININGTALYEAVAVVFIAQLNNIDLDFHLLFTVGITAAAFCFISRGAPARGAMMPLFVLNAVGLPVRDVWILVPVEWILDHFTTVVNVLGDCIGVALVHILSREELSTAEQHRDRARTEDSEGAREQETAM